MFKRCRNKRSTTPTGIKRGKRNNGNNAKDKPKRDFSRQEDEKKKRNGSTAGMKIARGHSFPLCCVGGLCASVVRWADERSPGSIVEARDGPACREKRQ